MNRNDSEKRKEGRMRQCLVNECAAAYPIHGQIDTKRVVKLIQKLHKLLFLFFQVEKKEDQVSVFFPSITFLFTN